MKPQIVLFSAFAILFAHSTVSAKDAIYSLKGSAPSAMTVDNEELVVRMPLKSVTAFKTKQIALDEADEGDYQIQIDLIEAPMKDFRPVFVLGEQTLMEEIMVGGSDVVGYAITIRTNDLETARDWLKRLKILLTLDDGKAVERTNKELEKPQE